MKTYLSVYFGSAILVLMITPIVIRLAQRLNIVDAPGIRKVHTKAVPRIGGVAIFISMMGLTIPVLFLPNVIGDSFRFVESKVIVMLLAAGFIFIIGLVDDIRGLRVMIKLLSQLAAAVIVCSAGIRINSFAITNSLVINFGALSWLITIFWIVGITNAVNFIDGLDGLAAGICAATCGVIVILTLQFALPVMTVIMLSLLGALTGFLFFNFNPAKIFMGDSGSLFLGFTIASSSVLCAAKTETIIGLALPILALGIPIFDTLICMLRRFLDRRSIFSPDSSHFHHRLLALGLNHRHAVIAAYIVTLSITGLGLFMLFTHNTQTIILFVCSLLLLILTFRAVGAIGLKKTISGLKQKHFIALQIKQEKENFEKAELYLQQAQTFDQWWQTLCFAADKLGFTKSSLPLTNRDGTGRILAWEKTAEVPDEYGILKMTIPIRDRRIGPPLNLEVEVNTNGFVESATRRAALFTRLTEKYSVANLPNTITNDSYRMK